MLTENDVIAHVAVELGRRGWTVHRTATTNERGHDLEASRSGVRLIVEAKGATSSKIGSARYGSRFTPNQVRSHVSRAVLTALQTVSDANANAGVALPDDAVHRQEVAKVRPALDRLNVTLYWVADDGSVEVDEPSLVGDSVGDSGEIGVRSVRLVRGPVALASNMAIGYSRTPHVADVLSRRRVIAGRPSDLPEMERP